MSSKRSLPRKSGSHYKAHDRKPHIQFEQTMLNLCSICKYCHLPFNGDGDDCGLCEDTHGTLATEQQYIATLQQNPHWSSNDLVPDWSSIKD